jgi:hypothetical protein
MSAKSSVPMAGRRNASMMLTSPAISPPAAMPRKRALTTSRIQNARTMAMSGGKIDQKP